MLNDVSLCHMETLSLDLAVLMPLPTKKTIQAKIKLSSVGLWALGFGKEHTGPEGSRGQTKEQKQLEVGKKWGEKKKRG